MESRSKSRVLAAVLLAAAALGVTACSGRQGSAHGPHHAHGHNHDYRHGYYNPVDGYFHDDHWHHQARNHRARHVHSSGCGHAVSYHYY